MMNNSLWNLCNLWRIFVFHSFR